jgi:hypothetical protein
MEEQKTFGIVITPNAIAGAPAMGVAVLFSTKAFAFQLVIFTQMPIADCAKQRVRSCTSIASGECPDRTSKYTPAFEWNRALNCYLRVSAIDHSSGRP